MCIILKAVFVCYAKTVGNLGRFISFEVRIAACTGESELENIRSNHIQNAIACWSHKCTQSP